MEQKIVFALPNSIGLGARIAERANAKKGELTISRFPDGETYVRFEEHIEGKEVILVQTMNPKPNEAMMEIVLAGRTAKELGAKKVVGVVPYLAYMRQDKRFHFGESLSNKIAAWMLMHGLDKIITVDPHLHRVKEMGELFHIEHKKLSANSAIAEFISKKFSGKDTVIVGPDIESSQWAKRIADSIGFRSAIFLKERFSPRKVKIKVTTELDWRGKNVVIVDDIVSSGHTMIEAVKEIKKRKPKAVHCICVHGIFAEGAFEKLGKAGAKTIVSTNSVVHKSNGIDLSELIAREI
ncbi:MAG: ribose-phosphate diphosphokinase [archaeon]